MKKWYSFKIIILLVFLLLFPGFASLKSISIKRIKGKEYIMLHELINRFNLDNSFDMISQKGKLYLKNHYAVYSVGLSAILIDGRLYKSNYEVRRRRGEVLLPCDAGRSIIESFYPGINLKRRGNTLCFKLKAHGKIPVVPEKEKSAYIKSRKDRISFIVIDPGHGGKDPGAIGKGGLREKVITLKIAKYLESRLRARLKNIKIKNTRNSDRFIELSQRTEIANKMLKKNDNGIFLSIHVNSSISGKVSGFETYFLSQNPTNEEARNTAALENNVIILEEKSKSHKKSYKDVDYIEAMMLTTQIQKESSILAKSIQKGMAKKNKMFKSRGVKKADFYVLRGALMPAVLIEAGFITNKREAQYLRRSSHQKIIANGIADGVALFIKRYNSLLKVN